MRKIARIVIMMVALCILISGSLMAAGKVNYKALPKKVDAIFAPYNSKSSPGAAVLIMKDGKVLYRHGYGMANLEYDIPITPATIFQVGSVSKQFTAFAILILAAEGKLSLDEDIRNYLPQLPDFGKKITIHNLLNHTSGLRDVWDLLPIVGYRYDDAITQDQILRMIYRQKELNFNPGEISLYCNTGYNLLSEIVTKASGQSFTEFTKKHIFEPLRMNHTRFHDNYAVIEKNMAYSYAPGDSGKEFWKAALNHSAVGSTNLFTTVEDLAQWINNFETHQVGSADLITQMQTPGKLNNGSPLNYAYGLMTGEYKGLPFITHGGADAGYRSTIYRFPEQRFAVVILSNLAVTYPDQLALQITDLYLADALQNPPADSQNTKHREITVDPAIYNEYTGRYQLWPGFIITITNENNHLMSQATGQGKFELFPEEKDTFFAKIADIQVTFIRDSQGKVVTLNVFQGGENYPGRKLNDATLPPAQLAEYCGEYYSAELAVNYKIYIKDGHLYTENLRFGVLPLEPLEMDNFNCLRIIALIFERNNQQQITGFLAYSGRVRNLKFTKIK